MGDMALGQQFQANLRRTHRKLGFSKRSRRSTRIEEASGMHVSISSDLPHAADHAASLFEKHYIDWRERQRYSAWGQYKRRHFTVAVGGGNTMKAQYQSMVEKLHSRVDWAQHVRFFFIEDSSGEGKWESPEDGLVKDFIGPLVRKLIIHRGWRALARELDLGEGADEDDILEEMCERMLNPMSMAEVKRALNSDNRTKALRAARSEAERYQSDIQHKLGENMAVHYLLSGIGKDGAIGSLSPYLPELAETSPGACVIKREKGAIRVALNRGFIVNAECVSLIVAGTHKLRALGRLEMEETADFEQTVMETPLRMLRDSPETSSKVLIFADEQALHFEETLFQYTENGEVRENKAETRQGEEKDGPHILLMHGFMGLFSFSSFLIRLPSAWTVSALHRGSYAKTLGEDEIFPHYARVLRKAMLKIWNQKRAVPIAGHSIAGSIIDHLLLSLLDDYDAPIKPYEKLKEQDRKLVDAMRASGVINLATWAPVDGLHAGANFANIWSHYRHKTELDYSGFEQIYYPDHELVLTEEATVSDEDSLGGLAKFLRTPLAKPLIGNFNLLLRKLLDSKTVQQRMLNINSPYILRLVGSRLLQRASIYGMMKEVNAALHDPVEYQRRHLRALDILIAYDIPVLGIIHADDFLVSAQRHKEEHQYLVDRRKEKFGIEREKDIPVTTRLVILKRSTEELPMDPLNPHLMIMATNNEGNAMARQITAAMTRFVNENLEKASRKRSIKSLASVRRWRNKHPLPKRSRARKT